MGTTASFRLALEKLINSHSRENHSNTPDFILAEFMMACLRAFEDGVAERYAWYGPDKQVMTMTEDGPKPVPVCTGKPRG